MLLICFHWVPSTHPVLDQFNEMHFLADIDKVLAQMKNDDSNIDAMNEVNALTVGYLKQMKRQRPDRAVKMITSYLKKNNLKAVPLLIRVLATV